jgi:hypothetical protein
MEGGARVAPVHTPEQKDLKLRMRKEESRKLGAHIDQLVRKAERGDVSIGCSTGLCAWVRRRMSRGEQVGVDAVEAVKNGTHTNVELHRAVFGLAGASKKGADPAAKLEEAAQVMRARIEQLEERAIAQRKVAVRASQAGQKVAAIRELKRAKAVEAQVEANQSSLMAVEQQVDMLAQAAMQKTLASALATTSKSMKKDAKAIGKAEAAIDDAQEARDMASDLNQVMLDFAGGGIEALDEDDLIAELATMVADEVVEEASESPQTRESARLAEISSLETRLASSQAQRERSDIHNAVVEMMPAAPSTLPQTMGKRFLKREEKNGLLKGVPASS